MPAKSPRHANIRQPGTMTTDLDTQLDKAQGLGQSWTNTHITVELVDFALDDLRVSGLLTNKQIQQDNQRSGPETTTAQLVDAWLRGYGRKDS